MDFGVDRWIDTWVVLAWRHEENHDKTAFATYSSRDVTLPVRVSSVPVTIDMMGMVILSREMKIGLFN